MRLNELFDGGLTHDIKKWLSNFNVIINIKHDYTDIDVKKPSQLVDKDGSLLEKIEIIYVEGKTQKTFTWPLLDTTTYDKLTVGLRGHNVVVDGFAHFPKVHRLNLEGCIVKSLKGIGDIQSLDLLEFIGDVQVVGGLLHLLKYKGKTLWAHKLTDERLEKALHIVEKHRVDGGNSAECVDELMTAGLKEFAKL